MHDIFYRWASKTDRIKNFFKVLKLEGPEFIPQKQLSEYDFNIYDKYNLDEKFKFPKGGAKKVNYYSPKFVCQVVYWYLL